MKIPDEILREQHEGKNNSINKQSCANDEPKRSAGRGKHGESAWAAAVSKAGGGGIRGSYEMSVI